MKELVKVGKSQKSVSTVPLEVDKENYGDGNIASNLTFASLPLTFQGREITSVMAGNLNPDFDLSDVRQDIPYIRHLRTEPVSWRWYQEGYDLESTDTNGVASPGSFPAP